MISQDNIKTFPFEHLLFQCMDAYPSQRGIILKSIESEFSDYLKGNLDYLYERYSSNKSFLNICGFKKSSESNKYMDLLNLSIKINVLTLKQYENTGLLD